MVWLLYIGGGLFALFVLVMLWGFLHLRQSQRKAADEIRRIELDQIPSLAKECVAAFNKKFGITLNPDDCEDSARKLDDAFRDSARLKDAFARDGFYWYFVKPVGAYLGELLRKHAKHEWRKKAGEAPTMEIKLKDGSSEVYPFDKVMKQITSGQPGDLVAYIEFARHVEAAAEGLRDSDE